MARDGSGTYTRVSNTFTTPISGTPIDPTDADAFWDELETEMTDSLSRSGKGGMSADLDMNNNDINEIKTAVFQGSTSGNTTVVATAIAGTTTLTLPAATDTLVGKATIDTLENKTLTSPTLVTPALGTPASGTLTNTTGFPVANLAGAGTGVLTALAVNVGSAGAPIVNGGALGTPSFGNLVNCTVVSTIAGNTGAFTLGYGLTNSTNEIRMRSGAVMGSVFGSYTANTTLSNLIPLDDTIPTSSEGDQILSVSYTPIISTSKLRCRFRGTVSNGSADNVVASIFQGTTNIGSQMVSITGANFKGIFSIEAEYSPGSTSEQTITVRVGGGTTAIALNGVPGARLLGGSQAATIVCEEIAP
jgi:hypothetical protein